MAKKNHKTTLSLIPIDPRTGTNTSSATRTGGFPQSSSIKTQPGITGPGNKTTVSGTPVTRPEIIKPGTVEPSDHIGEGYLYRIAVNVLHVILDRSPIFFPGSDRAAPSLTAVLYAGPGGAIQSRFDAYFPSVIQWEHWEYAIVPVIKDTSNQKAASRIKIALQRKDYDGVIKILMGELHKSFRDQGFLPKEVDIAAKSVEKEGSSSVESEVGLPRKKVAGQAPPSDDE